MKHKRWIIYAACCLVTALLLAGVVQTGFAADASLGDNSKNEELYAEVTEGEAQVNTDKKTIVIMGTGGTIAGAGVTSMQTGYQSGVLSVEYLRACVPDLEEVAELQTIQICNVNSDDITSEIWIQIANKINELAEDDTIDGFVITHGTDTMEETAYFLNLVVKTDKPVVLTGAMRPATAISADGPMNLYQAVCTAASEESRGKGVLVVFSDEIIAARTVQKQSTYSTMAICGGEFGNIGIIRNDTPLFYEMPIKCHTTQTDFDIAGMTSLPKVAIVYFAVDSDPELLRYAANNAEGLVIAGAGAGEFSLEFIDIINSLSIPVVISSRIDNGIITQDAVLCENTVAANNLSPQKAAILLRLAIANGTTSRQELIEIFQKY